MAGAPGLGLLAGLGGAAQGPGMGTGAPDPEELLSQIRELLGQYLAIGGDTPVAAEAQALATAIDSNAGGGEAGLEGLPGVGGDVPMPEEVGLEEELPPLEEPDPEAYSGSSMSQAHEGAKAFLKKKNKAKAE